MAENIANALRAELITALAANTARLRDALRVELNRPIPLDEYRPLQFEVDPWSWGIASCASEEAIITDDWLSRTLTWNWFERADAASVNCDAMISEELCPWFANCWQEVNGPTRFSPAYLFFHDYHDQQYDLERRCWVPAKVVFGE